jgi:hypothetical protein
MGYMWWQRFVKKGAKKFHAKSAEEQRRKEIQGSILCNSILVLLLNGYASA